MDEKKIEEDIKKILVHYLDPSRYQVFLFGSRAAGRAKKWSDFDIGIWGAQPLSLDILGLIKAKLSDSNIPVKVDLVDFSKVSEKFRAVGLKNMKVWQLS